MAAAALEQSMLESKDKDTLLEMAKALGVKANSRLKKADIITKILDTTGSSTSSSEASGNGSGSASGGSPSSAPRAEKPTEIPVVGAAVEGEAESASKPDERTRTTSGRNRQASAKKGDAKEGDAKQGDAKQGDAASADTKSADTKPAEASVQVGADGEPLADWEIQLAETGVETGVEDSSKETSTGSGRDSSRSGGDSQPRNRNSGRQPRNRNDGRGAVTATTARVAVTATLSPAAIAPTNRGVTVVVVVAVVAVVVRGAEARKGLKAKTSSFSYLQPRHRASSRSTSRVTSISETRAMGSFVSRGTSRARKMLISPSRSPASTACVEVTT